MRIKQIKPAFPMGIIHAGSIVSRLRKGYRLVQMRKMREGQQQMMGVPPGMSFYQQFFPQAGVLGKFVEKERFVERIIEKGGKGGGGDGAGQRLDVKVSPIPAGFSIPKEISKEAEFIPRGGIIAPEKIEMTYPLIPLNPQKGEPVFAYAAIRWDEESGQIIYNIIEPEISQFDVEIIESTKRVLEEQLDVDFFKLGPVKSKDILRDKIEKILTELMLEPGQKTIVIYYIERDIVGYGKLDPMMSDPNIEDISCDGVGIPIYIYHRDPKLGSLRSNVIFTSHEELNDFVVRLAQKSKKTITVAEPLLDASLPDGSRVQATLGTDIARKGSNYTIRKFTEKPLTPSHMLLYNTLDSTQLAYLWMAIENGQSILISGGTATGKTSMLNALSLFIRPNMKIVSIEDTPELRLPHPHWIPHVARTPLSVKRKIGEVTLFDLLKSSLRQRPDYIIVGEVRGKEAFVLFQQISTGHPGISTIHAASFPQLIDRLTTPPINLPPTLLENINVIVFVTLVRLKGRYVRRADTVMEVVGISNDKPLTRPIFRWNALNDAFETAEKSTMLEQLAKRLGMTEQGIIEELVRRKKILEWMLEKKIIDYKEVARIISMYYTEPNKVMNMMAAKARPLPTTASHPPSNIPSF